MSEPAPIHIGLIAEGPTDRVIIEAAIKAILQEQTFVLTLLQPDSIYPKIGAGWGGVLRWCAQFAADQAVLLADYPALMSFDLVVFHLDADVASFQYTDISRELVVEPRWGALPNNVPCPPCEAAADHVRALLLSWLALDALEPHCVMCVPSKSSEAWLGIAAYPDNARISADAECSMNMEARLGALPKGLRIRNKVAEYNPHAPKITASWSSVCAALSQARRFHDAMSAAYATCVLAVQTQEA